MLCTYPKTPHPKAFPRERGQWVSDRCLFLSLLVKSEPDRRNEFDAVHNAACTPSQCFRRIIITLELFYHGNQYGLITAKCVGYRGFRSVRASACGLSWDHPECKPNQGKTKWCPTATIRSPDHNRESIQIDDTLPLPSVRRIIPGNKFDRSRKV